MRADDETTGALAGVRVLDLATERAGSVATMLLADLGADVVRPETAAGAHRRPDPRHDVAGLCWDRGKRRVVLDGLDPRRDVDLARLCAAADVAVVDAGPSALAARGLSPDALATAHRGLVVGWLPANGMHGPAADLPAEPLLLAALSGFAQLQPAAVDVPVAPVVPYVGNVQGALGAAAVVAALLERERNGAGQVVTVSGLHAAALLLGTVTGESLDRPMAYKAPRDVRAAPFYRPYRGADGAWFFLGALVPTIFVTALDAIGMLEVMVLPGVDGDFMNLLVADNGLRAAAALEARFAEQPRRHWLEVLAAAGVPAAAVQTREEWRASDAFLAVGGLVARDHPALGPVLVPAPPLALTATPAVAGPLADATPPLAPTDVWNEPCPDPSPPPPGGVRDTASAPLSGLRVLDLSTFVAAPTAPALLGQWGAEVIKVEPPSGDPYRLYNVAYAGVNQGKRRVVLDLTTAEGRTAFAALAAGADVLVDNFRPGLRARTGVSTDALHARNPRLVHATVTAFGDDGPLADAPGFDPVLQACGGLMHACGDDTGPYYTSTPVHDVAAGSLVAVGTLAALYARSRTGRGQRVAVSLAASTLLVQAEELTSHPSRRPAARGGVAFVGTEPNRRYYRAADGWVAIAVPVGRLGELLAWAGAREHDDAAAVIARAVAVRNAADVVAELSARGIAAVRVVERDEIATDPHLVAHRLFHVVSDDEVGRCRAVHQVAAWSRSIPVDATRGPGREPDAPVWLGPGSPATACGSAG